MKIASPFKLHVHPFSEILGIIIIAFVSRRGDRDWVCVSVCENGGERKTQIQGFGFVHMPIEDSDFWGFYCIQMGDQLCVSASQKCSKRKA
ncbi:unnamed protein product [Coffea canephora]|uniref:Uncharacterized protein n=1 Tax=Coffea canephora TaxID=49390 RepID=A0A068UYQ2_COFCA|nr:unnamed protein product [Coffea canephora]